MGYHRHKKKTVHLVLAFLMLFSVTFSTLLTTLPQKAYAEDNDALSMSDQHARTLLYAIGFCFGKDSNNLLQRVSAGQLNSFDIYGSTAGWGFKTDGVGIGYEIDSDNGERYCKNLNHGAALGFIGMKVLDFKNALYTCDSGWCDLKDGAAEDMDSELQRLRGARRVSSGTGGAIGPKERARRVLVGLSRCIEPVKAGNVPEGSGSEVIDGVTYQYREGKKSGDTIPLGHDMAKDGSFECGTLANMARSENMMDTLPEGVSLSNLFSNPSAASPDGDVGLGTDGESTDVAPSCESEGGAMSWLLCPVVKAIDSALNWVDTQIQALLEINAGYYSNPQLKEAYANIRNIAFIILVPIVLVMVIGTALGFDFVSAYTVKRALPRLLIAVLFISLSYNICIFLIQFFNELGSATLGILTAPFSTDVHNLSLTTLFGPAGGLGSIMVNIITAGAAAIGLVLALWLFGGTILLFITMAFFILMLRQMFIVFLMMAAPLAILAWIFPGNDRLWKLWWGSFSKLLIMYPLIMGLIAMGRVFAFLIDGSNPAGLEGAILAPLMTIIAYAIPYAFIPFTFKFAGGMFATVAGMANDRSKGLFDRQRKSRAGKLERTSTGNMFKNAPERSLRGRMNTIGAGAMNVNKAGLRPTRWRTNMRSALAGNAMLEASEASDKNESYQSWKGDDDLNRAALTASLEGRDIRDVLRERGYAGHGDANVDQAQARRAIDMAASRVERTRKEVSEKAFQQMTWLNAVKGGTAYDYTDDSSGAEAWRDAGRVAGNDDAVLATLVAKGRDAAMGAGRIDQGGAGFGATFTAAQAMRDGGLSEDQAAARVHRGVVESQGPGVLAHASMKPRSIQQLVPELRERLIEAEAQGGDAYERELAIVASVYDSMASSSPQNARILADEVLRWDPGSGAAGQPLQPGVAGPVAPGRTIQQAIEQNRDREVFQSTRRELNASQARMGQIGGGAVGNQPAGGGPAGPPTAP